MPLLPKPKLGFKMGVTKNSTSSRTQNKSPKNAKKEKLLVPFWKIFHCVTFEHAILVCKIAVIYSPNCHTKNVVGLLAVILVVSC